MNRYKFRADTQADVVEFLAAAFRWCDSRNSRHPFTMWTLRVDRWIHDSEIDSAVVEITTNMCVNTIRELMQQVESLHRMAMTLAPADEYTGRLSGACLLRGS